MCAALAAPSSGYEPPRRLIFGSYTLKGEACTDAVRCAIAAGYKAIDTGSSYGNEADIGAAVEGHDDVVLQSKVGPRDMGHAKARKAVRKSKRRLGRLDLVLLHWPGRDRQLRAETWRALEDSYSEGEVGGIGVSNFLPDHIEQLKEDGAKVLPMVNQFECHPLCQVTLSSVPVPPDNPTPVG